METIICNSKTELGQQAATRGAQSIRDAIGERGEARVIVATGASQFETLSALCRPSSKRPISIGAASPSFISMNTSA